MKEYAAFLTLIVTFETVAIVLFLFTTWDIISIFFVCWLFALVVAGIFSYIFNV